MLPLEVGDGEQLVGGWVNSCGERTNKCINKLDVRLPLVFFRVRGRSARCDGAMRVNGVVLVRCLFLVASFAVCNDNVFVLRRRLL